MFQSALASVRTTGRHQAANETLDAHLHPLFRTNLASDALITTFKVDGNVPGRKTWNLEQAQDRLAPVSNCTFALKTLSNRDWKLAKNDAKKRAKGIDPLAVEGPPISEARASLAGASRASVSSSAPDLFGGTSPAGSNCRGSDSPAGRQLQDTGEKPLTRADKYYQALLKAEKARKEAKKIEAWEEYTTKAQRAAEKAKKQALKAEMHVEGAAWDSDTEDDEDDEEEEPEDPGPLQPYPGLMKVEVEVVVLRAPGNDGSDTESSVDPDAASVHTPSSASGRSNADDDGVDWAKELQDLQEQFQDNEEVAESESSSLPDGLGARTIGNVHNNSHKRTALGLGGTAFFVPEVERYALAPSLLPPPPRGEGHLARTGHKRLKLKPRLPLEISRNRWRDEHPYGCPPEEEYRIDADAMRSWEEQVRRVELYGTLNKFFTAMPKPDGIRKLPKKDNFERTLDWELKDSLAWQQYIKRQRLIEIARSERNDKQKANAASIMEGYAPGKPEAKAKPEKKPMKRMGVEAPVEAPEAEKPNTSGSERPVPIIRPAPLPLRLHPGAPPMKLCGPPGEAPLQVGQPSPPSTARKVKGGLMSVAPAVRKGLY